MVFALPLSHIVMPAKSWKPSLVSWRQVILSMSTTIFVAKDRCLARLGAILGPMDDPDPANAAECPLRGSNAPFRQPIRR